MDGAKEPEKIPDSLAYSHFILSVAEPDKPSAEQLARRTAMLAPVQLSKEDKLAVVTALRGVHSQIEAIKRDVERLSAGASPSRSDELRLRRTRVLDEAMTRLSETLSTDGAARLDLYIKAEVRHKIVIYGTPSE